MANKAEELKGSGAPHEHTWGATEAAKAAWDSKNGSAARKANKEREAGKENGA